MPESATFEAIQTQELDDDSLLKDTLSVTIKGDEKLLDAEYMAVKSYTGNAQAFDMYRIVTDTTPDKSMSFTGMSLAPYELNGHIIQDLRPANHSLEYTLNRVLDGTDWRVGYIEDGLSNVTTTFYYVSAKEALKELQSLIGCEFVFKVEISGQKITDKWIEVYKEMGNRTKKRFNYGTNALTVVRETNKADIYTALIGRGKGEEVSSAVENESGQAGYGRKITFEDIEWSTANGNPLDKPIGQYYLELPQATQAYGIKNIDGTMTPRIGIVDFDDEEDKNRLINLTYQQLLVSSRPKVLFKSSVANIGATGIGDTVTIHRHDLNIHYQTRVRKIVRNKLNDNKTQIELGDAVVTSSTKRSKQNNAIIKNLNQELERVRADVTISQLSADGKNAITYGSAEPTTKRTGDMWYRPHPSIAGETQMLVWNGNAWELVLDSSDLASVSREVENAISKAEEAKALAVSEAGQALVNANNYADAQDALITQQVSSDVNTAISTANTAKATAESSYNNAVAEAARLDGEQKLAFDERFSTVEGSVTTLNTSVTDADAKAEAIKQGLGLADITLTNQQITEQIKLDYDATKSTASTALADAKSAMDEAKLADVKIANYVTTNGLVSGTTVDSKINTAKGEISQSITTVEGKIPTYVGGRNLVLNTEGKLYRTFGSGATISEVDGATRLTWTGTSQNSMGEKLSVPLVVGETYTLSFEARGTITSPYIELYILTSSGANFNFTSALSDGVVTNEFKKYTVTFEFTGNPSDRLFIGGRGPSGTWLEVKDATVKLEKGNIATDWSPAPEDMQSVSDLDKNITAIYNNTSSETSKAINQTLSAYTLDTNFNSKTQNYLTSNQYQTASQVTNTLSAYTKTTNLDSTVASYLNNASTATAGAINTKLTAYQTTTGLDSSVASLLSNTTSQTAGGINSKLTAIEGKIPTEIGGRNLFRNSNFADGLKFWQSNGQISRANVDGNYAILLTGTNLGFYQTPTQVETGGVYTISFKAKSVGNSSQIRFGFLNQPTGNETTKVIDNTWKTYSFTTEGAISINMNTYFHFYAVPNTAQGLYITDLKIEQGTIPSDWSPAPEDMATVIKTNEIERTADYSKMAITNLSKNGVVESSSVNTTKDGITERVAKVDANGNITYSNRNVKLDSIVTSVADANYLSQQIQTSSLIQSTIKSKTDITNISGAKTFTNLTGYSRETTPVIGYLIIRTPINSNNMVNIHIGGYNYVTNKSDIDIDVSFYRYQATSILNHSYSNKGNFDFGKVQVGTDSAGRAVIVLGLANTSYSYPKITVDKAIIGYGSVPDSYINGWSATISTDLTGIGSLTNIDGMAIQSKVTQLAGSWSMQLTKADDVVTQINATSAGVLIQGDNIQLDGNVSMTSTFSVPNANIKDLAVSKLTGVTADFTSLVTKGLTADVITSTMIKADTAFFDMLFSTTSATTRLVARGAWITNANIVSLDASKITAGTIATARLNATQIVTTGLSANVVKSTHIEGSTALIDKMFATTALIQQLTSKTAFISSIQAIDISATRITSGTLDASKITVTNLDASSITANQASLIQAGFTSSSGGTLALSGDQILSTASDGSQTYIQNGLVGTRNPDGATIGQIGYVFNGGSPTYTIQTSWGSNFAINQRFYDSYTQGTKNKEALAMYTTDDGYSETTIRMSRINILGDAHLSFHFTHSINGNDNQRLTVNGAESVGLRARDSTVFAVSNNGSTNFASLYANLNMQGSQVTNTSDIRLKRDIVNDEIDSLSALMKWQHAGFNYIDPDMNQERQFGVIAQSAPDLAFAGEDGYLQVALNKQVNMTSHALQQHVIETNTELESLKSQVASLQDELALLKGA